MTEDKETAQEPGAEETAPEAGVQETQDHPGDDSAQADTDDSHAEDSETETTAESPESQSDATPADGVQEAEQAPDGTPEAIDSEDGAEDPDFESRIAEYRFQVEQFDGPLDLLLHLIKEKKMDIFNITLAPITEEFLEYVKAAQQLNLSSIGEFLVVAATLIRIKSRMLLPREEAPLEDEEDEDDGALLLRRLEDYQRFKNIAEILREHEAKRQSSYIREPRPDDAEEEGVEFFEVDIYDLYSAFRKIMEEIESRAPREIVPEEFTVDEKMVEVQLLLKDQGRFSLPIYLMACRSRLEVIVIFLAMLELIRQRKVRARQEQANGEIWICRPDHDPESD